MAPNPAARRAGYQRNLVKNKKMPAPIGGLNVKDISRMPPTDAISLINWVPEQYGIRCRKGYYEHCIGLDGEVRTLAIYQPNRQTPGTTKLFAFTDAKIYDVTASSNTPPMSLVMSGVADSGRYSTCLYSNIAGIFMLACSHEGQYRYFDGTNWQTPTMGAGAGQVAGIDPVKLCYVTSFKRRAWFVERNSADLWYSDPDAITGTFARFNVGPFLKHGGAVAWVENWTIDGGEGTDDYLVIAGENGDILLYKGTDPTSASTFAMVGAWYVGQLVGGRRSVTAYGGDLLILCREGLQPLSYLMKGGQALLSVSAVRYLEKVNQKLGELASADLDSKKWELRTIPGHNLLMVQKPNASVSLYEQYVMNTDTAGWCVFNGLPMLTSLDTALGYYFGTADGKVCKGLEGFFDAVPYGETVGNGLAGVIQQAYSDFDAPGRAKTFTMVRPVFTASDRPSVIISILVDYKLDHVSGSPTYALPAGSLWDVALWDAGIWGGSLNTYMDWAGAAAEGFAGSIYMATVCLGDTFLASTDVQYQVGNPW